MKTGQRWKLAGALGAFVLAAATGAAVAQTPVRGGSLVFVIGADPPHSNPLLTTSSDVGAIGCVVYEGLTTIGPDGIPTPRLAKSWKVSPDGRTYDFELVNAKWHDGKPFTSADVKWSLSEVSAKLHAVFAPAGKAIESIETPAPNRVVVNLSKPFGPFLISLSCTHGGAILPKHVFEGTDIARNPASIDAPIGTGPFKVVQWTRGDNIRMVRNPEYWDTGKPYLDEVVGKILPQPASRAQALLSGQVDFISYFYLPNSSYESIRANRNFKLTPSPVAPSMDMFFLNTKRKPLDDKRVRQALFTAIDRDFMMKSAFRNVGQPGGAPFGKVGTWWESPDIDYQKLYAFNPEKANRMLDEAGYRKGADGTRFTLRFAYSTDDAEAASFSVALQTMWRQVGVKLNIEPVDRASSTKKVFVDQDYDTFMTAYTSYFDPALGLTRAWSSTAFGRPFGNPTGFATPELDALFDEAAHLTSLQDRTAVYNKAQKILADEASVFNIRDKKPFDAASVRVRGYEKENHLNTWREVWLAK